jgi:hypothetical protein
MRCLSCNNAVPAGEGKLFAEVFCCPNCYTRAERTMERALADLQNLRIMMKDLIRQALLEGRLQFQPEPAGDVPKQALLSRLAMLAESWPQSQSSTESTSPAAPSVAGSASSSPTLGVDSK